MISSATKTLSASDTASGAPIIKSEFRSAHRSGKSGAIGSELSSGSQADVPISVSNHSLPYPASAGIFSPSSGEVGSGGVNMMSGDSLSITSPSGDQAPRPPFKESLAASARPQLAAHATWSAVGSVDGASIITAAPSSVRASVLSPSQSTAVPVGAVSPASKPAAASLSDDDEVIHNDVVSQSALSPTLRADADGVVRSREPLPNRTDRAAVGRNACSSDFAEAIVPSTSEPCPSDGDVPASGAVRVGAAAVAAAITPAVSLGESDSDGEGEQSGCESASGRRAARLGHAERRWWRVGKEATRVEGASSASPCGGPSLKGSAPRTARAAAAAPPPSACAPSLSVKKADTRVVSPAVVPTSAHTPPFTPDAPCQWEAAADADDAPSGGRAKVNGCIGAPRAQPKGELGTGRAVRELLNETAIEASTLAERSKGAAGEYTGAWASVPSLVVEKAEVASPAKVPGANVGDAVRCTLRPDDASPTESQKVRYDVNEDGISDSEFADGPRDGSGECNVIAEEIAEGAEMRLMHGKMTKVQGNVEADATRNAHDVVDLKVSPVDATSPDGEPHENGRVTQTMSKLASWMSGGVGRSLSWVSKHLSRPSSNGSSPSSRPSSMGGTSELKSSDATVSKSQDEQMKPAQKQMPLAALDKNLGAPRVSRGLDESAKLKFAQTPSASS